MGVSWCTAIGSELARLRFSNRGSSSAGGSCSSQEEIRVVLSGKVEGDAGGDVAMVMCGVVGGSKLFWCCCFTKLGTLG
jgi:hypothetical protein